MLTIRFIRTGKKNQPFFKIVVTDKKNSPKGGRFVEVLGFFDPKTKQSDLKADKIKYWLSVGAKASDTAHNLFVENKIIDSQKIPVKIPKKKAEEKPAEPAKKEAEKPAETETKEEKKEEVKEEVAEIAEVKEEGTV